MSDLNDKQKADYFRRIFTVVDGLWFMKIEEQFGFDKALEIDDAVWKIAPKIQARELKAMMKLGTGLAAFRECLIALLSMEQYGFKVEPDENEGGFKIVIDSCPWHNTMVRSGREHLSSKVGNIICHNEFSIMAKEFACQFHLDSQNRICLGSKVCILHFSGKEM